MTEDQIKTIAKTAADEAVRKFFAILGVDANKPEAIEDFREDLRFARRMRSLAAKGALAFVSILAAAIWALVTRGGH